MQKVYPVAARAGATGPARSVGGEQVVDAGGNDEVVTGQPADGVGAEGQADLVPGVKAEIWMVALIFSQFGDAVQKSHGSGEALEPQVADNGLRILGQDPAGMHPGAQGR